LFDQYLRTTQIPVLEYKIQSGKLLYHWANCIDGFNMPVKLSNSDQWITPGTDWKELKSGGAMKDDLKIDNNFYINVKKV